MYLEAPNSSMVHHVYFSAPGSSTAPLFVFHHGAGSSGLSFAACAAEMRSRAPDIGLLAVDARGHGRTTMRALSEPRGSGGVDIKARDEQALAAGAGQEREGAFDLSLPTLAADLEAVIELVAREQGWVELRNLVLVGHSLGGAVVTQVARGGKFGSKLLGFAVLDVVEGELSEQADGPPGLTASRFGHGGSAEHADVPGDAAQDVPVG